MTPTIPARTVREAQLQISALRSKIAVRALLIATLKQSYISSDNAPADQEVRREDGVIVPLEHLELVVNDLEEQQLVDTAELEILEDMPVAPLPEPKIEPAPKKKERHGKARDAKADLQPRRFDRTAS